MGVGCGQAINVFHVWEKRECVSGWPEVQAMAEDDSFSLLATLVIFNSGRMLKWTQCHPTKTAFPNFLGNWVCALIKSEGNTV